jgi:aminoglycoside 6'-N-acetyltransferase
MRIASPTMPLVLRPLQQDDADALRRIHREPEVVRWWDEPAEGFPFDEPESTRLTIEISGEVAGMIQFSEEPEPKYRHATLDIFLSGQHHRRGFGSEAVRLLCEHLLGTRGHHRITIDPAVENAAAVRAYEKAGFRTVGVMRLAERDADGRGWHDALLMELVRT